MKERVKVILPLTVPTVTKMMIAVDDIWPGAKLLEPTAEERDRHGELLVFEVDVD